MYTLKLAADFGTENVADSVSVSTHRQLNGSDRRSYQPQIQEQCDVSTANKLC